MPNCSRAILTKAFNESFKHVMKLYENDPSISVMDVLESTVIQSLRVSRMTGNPPIILLKKHVKSFESKGKKPPFAIAVIQPKFPTNAQFNLTQINRGTLFEIKKEARKEIILEMKRIIEILKAEEKIDFVCLPELSFIKNKEVTNLFLDLAKEKDCFIVAGSYHNIRKQTNVSFIFTPDGKIIRQNKIFSAPEEGLLEDAIEHLNLITTPDGNFCVLICIDSEKECIREIMKEIKNTDYCPVLIFNPSFNHHPNRAISILGGGIMLLLSAAIIFVNNCEDGKSSVLLPLTRLRNNQFKLFEFPAANKTMFRIENIDTISLQRNRAAKQQGYVTLLT